MSSHSYTYDDVDRRTRATLADGSAWAYDYDDRNEVVSGKRLWADQVPVAGQQFEYAYDSIGNRTTAKLGGDASGANFQLNTYTANGLNQYTVRTNASVVDVLGAAKATASVTVNGTAAYEKGEYFWRAVPVSNGSAPVYPTLSAVATEAPNSATNSGRVYLGPVREDFTYDLDGNLTADSRWDYTWDAENRLKSLETRSAAISAGVPKTRLEFAYDAEGRRTSKSVLTNWNGAYYLATNTTRFLYDPGILPGGGWNLLAEVDRTNKVLRSYVWGLDLAGNQETDGNIGGLLMVVDHTGASPSCHFTAYDGNGNITALVKTDQTTSAAYEYGPFGEALRATGPLAKANPFRWSTKFTDTESGLVDYGYRFYSPGLGRWISRDPIEEGDCPNLYCFVNNTTLRNTDSLGLEGTAAEQEGAAGVAGELGATSGSQATTYKQGVQEVFDNWNEMQEFVVAAANSDVDGMLEAGLEIAQNIFSRRLKLTKRGPDLEGHHSHPTAYGGLLNQGKTDIPGDQHSALHSALYGFMKNFNMHTYGGKNARSGLQVVERRGREAVLRRLGDFYRGMDKRLGDKYSALRQAAEDFFRQHPHLR